MQRADLQDADLVRVASGLLASAPNIQVTQGALIEGFASGGRYDVIFVALRPAAGSITVAAPENPRPDRTGVDISSDRARLRLSLEIAERRRMPLGGGQSYSITRNVKSVPA